MLMIVAGHFIGQSGLRAIHGNSMCLLLCGSGARWAVNLFLIVACWFMVDYTFKAERIARLYLTVLFYSVPLTILAIVWGNPLEKDVLRGFAPFWGRPLWFFSAYFSLALMAPWLKSVFRLTRRSFGGLVALLTVIIPGICTLPDPQMCYTVDVCYFLYMFILVGILKPLLSSSGRYKYFAFIAGISLYVLLVVLQQKGGPLTREWATQCLADFKTLPNLVSALLVFQFFLHLNIGSIRWINWIASSAFAVYVIHSTPAFYPLLWSKVFQVGRWLYSESYPLYTAGVVAAVYLSGILLEFPRHLLVERWLLSCATIQRLLKKVDYIYANVC